MDGRNPQTRESTLALIEAMLCGEITPEDQQRLNDLLKNDDTARLIFVEHMDLQAEVLRLAGRAQPVPEPNLMHRPVGGAALRTAAWMLVATAVSALLIVPAIVRFFATQPAQPQAAPQIVADAGPLPLVATLVAEFDATWGEVMDLPSLPVGTEMRAGDWIELEAGAAVLELRSGVRCVISGETLLSFDGGQNCFLDSGLATFEVPPQAIGFEVTTHGGKFVDRGTEFGVAVGVMGESEVHVFKGLVDAQTDFADGNVQTLRLSRHHAATLNPHTRSLSLTRFDVNTFAVPIAISEGVSRISPTVRFVPEPLAEIIPHELQEFGRVFLCPEQTEVLEQELVVYERFDFLATDAPTPRRPLPAGTRLKSYLVHFSPGRDSTVDGEITFQMPIAGLVADGPGLLATDAVFVHSETSLADADRPLRAIETPSAAAIAGNGDLSTFDRLRVSGPDGKTLSFHLKGSQVDQFRVLVHADPESLEPANGPDNGEK
ncbi:FecR protein [Maioricimonas rarisocia]|uniref:FecR protein n=1 Tax=Maioricimonas rarisocia TaxID=2528026 RepID=A0A517Z689_9PLAN|nr:FecR domain-containing protein [Maioricimonas rarisocia]QDU38010.1 FecR protein [Maioricimonas rarisocia]